MAARIPADTGLLMVKIVITSQMLRWSQRTLLAAAIVLLGYCGFVAVTAWSFQYRESRELEVRLAMPVPAAAAAANAPLVSGDLIGRIEIPRLHLSVIVIEGTSRETLERAVGHIAGTALPGGNGNVGLSAHRDTFFRPLRNIRVGDLIRVTTPGGKFNYQVVSTRVVEPTEVSVLDSTGKDILTLVTCYPFYFVGSAPERFIVRAERHS